MEEMGREGIFIFMCFGGRTLLKETKGGRREVVKCVICTNTISYYSIVDDVSSVCVCVL